MMRSLRTKVALFIALLFVVAFGILAGVSTQIERVEERAFIQKDQLTPLLHLNSLTSYYSTHRSWHGVEPVLAHAAHTAGVDLLLLDSRNRFVTASDPHIGDVRTKPLANGGTELDVQRAAGGGFFMTRLQFLRPPYPIYIGNRLVANVFPAPRPQTPPPPQQVLSTFNRKLLLALTVIAVLSIVSGLLLAQYLLDPIRKLSAAAERLRRGQYQQIRVDRSDEVGTLAQTFNALSTELERADRQRKELIADIAHELRSPLTNIRCAVEEMRDGLARPSPAYLQSLLDEVMQLQRLISDLHDLAMADAHTLQLKMQHVNLQQEISSAFAAMSKQFHDRSIRLTFDMPSQPLTVQADPARLRQILNNLSSNALRVTPPNGAIHLAVARNGSSAAISLKDSGPGFDPAHADQLFERFYREEPSRSRETGGSGLGLAVTRQLVEAQGGTITAVNTGHGARFTFTLNLSS